MELFYFAKEPSPEAIMVRLQSWILRAGRYLPIHLDSSPLFEGEETQCLAFMKAEEILTLWKFVLPQNISEDAYRVSYYALGAYLARIPCISAPGASPWSPSYTKIPYTQLAELQQPEILPVPETGLRLLHLRV